MGKYTVCRAEKDGNKMFIAYTCDKATWTVKYAFYDLGSLDWSFCLRKEAIENLKKHPLITSVNQGSSRENIEYRLKTLLATNQPVEEEISSDEESEDDED